jgi:nucleoid-associated protein YgaU
MGKHGRPDNDKDRRFPFWFWLILAVAIGTALGLTVLLNSPQSPPVKPQSLATFTPMPHVPQTPVASPEPSQARTYTVKSGDTLGSIAQRYCGTSSGYQALYAANRKTISDMNVLSVGQVITIAC